MQPSAILESALYVTDLDATEAFYADVLGLERIAKADGRHVFFRCGDGVLLLFDAEATREPPSPDASLPVPPHGTTGRGHMCFRVSAEALDAWRAKLEASGVAIESDLRWPNGARSFYFRDPAGNSLECAEPGLWSIE